MKAEIKAIFSTDIENLELFQPNEEDNFSFPLRLLVGLKDEDGEESFDIIVVTPKWLIANHLKSEIIFGRHYLIVFEYNYQNILKRLEKYINSLDGNSWEDFALKIARIGYWEFEDYKEF